MSFSFNLPRDNIKWEKNTLQIQNRTTNGKCVAFMIHSICVFVLFLFLAVSNNLFCLECAFDMHKFVTHIKMVNETKKKVKNLFWTNTDNCCQCSLADGQHAFIEFPFSFIRYGVFFLLSYSVVVIYLILKFLPN